jgi:ribosomal-protein-alanine N-acetyltransferase
MIFETDRLYVRQWQDTDLQNLHRLYSDRAIMEYIRPVLTIEETKQIFDKQITEYSASQYVGRYLILEKNSDSFVGIFLLRKPENRDGIEIGYAFRLQDWGKGFATEIVKEGVQYIFTATEFSSIYAFTGMQNVNSKNVLIKSGFTFLENIIEDSEELNVFSLDKRLN